MLNTSTPQSAPRLDSLLAARYIGFVGFLRHNGLKVACTDAADVMQALLRTGQLDSQVTRWTLRTLLCSRADDWRRFDELFDAWFLPPNRQTLVQVSPGGARAIDLAQSGHRADNSHGMPLSADSGPELANSGSTTVEGASSQESLMFADFRHLHQPDETHAMETLMRQFAQRLRHIQRRRESPSHSGRRIDMARTIRRCISHGGMPLELAWRSKHRQRPRLVLLLDVSRSMNLYSFFYLRLARALSALLADVHCFIFHTRLAGIAQALRDPDPWRSQERLQLLSAGWSGGTRIGECLQQFQQQYANALLHSRSVVIIVSDGYDAGPVSQLTGALVAIRKRARSIVWLNPLIGREGFTPSSIGMSSALPHLDVLAPGHNLASLQEALPKILRACL
jgi:uncharacterized protein with von Willebrand factor type A (vWA) domain